MQGNALRLLQIYLWLICAFHVVIGLGVNLSRDFIAATAAGYGAEVDLTPQFVTILHPLAGIQSGERKGPRFERVRRRRKRHFYKR